MKPVMFIAGSTYKPDAEIKNLAEEIGWSVLDAAMLPECNRYPICMTMVEQVDAIYVLPQTEEYKDVTGELVYAAELGKVFLYNTDDMYWYYDMFTVNDTTQLNMRRMENGRNY